MIKVNELGKKYGENIIFQKLSFQVNHGETVGISGASGCGKTTLLRCLCGLDNEYMGNIEIDNRLMKKNIKPNKRNMALVMQDSVLWSHMTVKENILYPLKKAEQKRKEVIFEEICNNMQIQDLIGRYPHEISGGQAKRVSFARAIMSDKEILLLDEPLSNVDTDTKHKIELYLQEKYIGKKTIIYVSHDKNELKMICNRMIYLNDRKE